MVSPGYTDKDGVQSTSEIHVYAQQLVHIQSEHHAVILVAMQTMGC